MIKPPHSQTTPVRVNILEDICCHLAETLHAQSVWLGLPDEVQQQVEVACAHPLADVLAMLPPKVRLEATSPSGAAGQGLGHPDGVFLPPFTSQDNENNPSNVRSSVPHTIEENLARQLFWATAPVIFEGLPPGVLLVARGQPFLPDQLARISDSALKWIVLPIEHALLESERRRADESNAIIEFSLAISQSLEIDQVFNSAQRAVERLMPSDAFFISLCDRHSNKTIITHLVDKGVRYPSAPWPMDSGLSGYVIRTGKTILIHDLENEGTPFDGILYGDKEPVRSIVAVPLHFGKEIIGMISSQSYRRNVYSDHDVHLLQSIADPIAIAIDKAQQYADLEKRYLHLQEIDRVRLEFIQNVSHELRTPLTFLRAYVDLLLEGGMGDLNENQRSSLTIVQAKTATLVRLVEDITTLESSGPDWLIIQDIDLIELAKEAIRLAENSAAQLSNQLVLEAPASLPAVQADPDRLAQVFDNLLSNALKYSGENNAIVIRLEEHPHHVQVSVTDQGKGIPKGQQAHIFERFYQANGALSHSHAGIGLGLAIVKHIVESHGGKIWVESQEGSGSTFFFTLPYHFQKEGRKSSS